MAKKKRHTHTAAQVKKNHKQMRERFCIEYFRTGKIGDSARAAGYSQHGESANQYAASRLLKRPDVIKRLAELQKAAENAAIADVVERKKVLTEIVRGRVSQYIDGNRISVKPESVNSAAVQEISTSEVKLGRGDDSELIEITKLKLRDPIAAISELNKMEKIYSDGAQVNIDNRTLNIIVRNPESAALIDRIGERRQLDGD
jgi:phage terminase small subunit